MDQLEVIVDRTLNVLNMHCRRDRDAAKKLVDSGAISVLNEVFASFTEIGPCYDGSGEDRRFTHFEGHSQP